MNDILVVPEFILFSATESTEFTEIIL